MSSPQIIRLDSMMARLEHHDIFTVERTELYKCGIAEHAGWIGDSSYVLCRPIDGWLENAKRIDSIRRLAAT